MATQLKEDTDVSTLEAKMELVSKFNLDSTAQVPIPPGITPGFPTPQRIIVRELDIVPGPMGPLAFVRPDRAHPCNGLADVREIISDIRGGGYNYQPNTGLYYRPLDLNLSAPTCFIFRLSSTWNWRFSHQAKGATLGPKAVQANYCNLKHVLDNDEGQDYEFGHSEYCRLIYFFARPVAGAPAPEFKHPFNLNIEFVYADGSGNDKVNTIPIIVDPDIRFPGGSGEP